MNEEIKDINTEETAPLETDATPVVETQEETTEEATQEWTAEFEGHDKSDDNEENKSEESSDSNDDVVDIEDSPEVEEDVQEEESAIEVEKVEEESTDSEEVTESEEGEVSEEAVISALDSSDLPEYIQNIIKFHEETGGDLEAYNTVNLDYSQMNEDDLVRRFIKSENPDFTDEEVQWEMEDKFGVDEDWDEDSREYKKAVLNKKRAVSSAQKHFNGMKEKYVSNLKSNKGKTEIPQEYQEAFAAQQKSQEQAKTNDEWNKSYSSQTKEFYKDEQFKGFVFDTGDSKYRIKETSFDTTQKAQSAFDVLSKEHLDKNGNVKDMGALQKALYSARNSDKIAKHFYQQGKADALAARAKETKNIDMEPKTKDAKPFTGTKFEFL